MDHDDSPYAAPKAPVADAFEPPPREAASLVLGVVVGLLAPVAGGVVGVGWAMFMILAGAKDPDAAYGLMSYGALAVVLVPLALLAWLRKRARKRTVHAYVATLLALAILFGAYVAWIAVEQWLYRP